ncbi:MAPK kinase substrate protein At1g80180 [Brachypodium distachyon]|uniref:Uncharacterized protein n=1 Tax=Brachypodium distachyon TaxID=15368 RepID=A0A0Q3JAN7_BRADI|nr:MAPK kinase substrate protein At1g80180 [Brachypodium distachyon]KQK09388.1 hypothetical protein BRADI_2g47675v3 [Brachypodium distachyon]PNT72674.1 hypothetical protein BRADI_2g47675v3 [Brachypodium distachyon]PNT72675.1 hypothetical protein BRADI_2g47675v3 [Brachypodium distachyon]|eukprot:XP_003569640.1 MAPK kinase substrate protein At1g80180 [Brachypodium distachyon]
MAGLQRSSETFRRSGSSGMVWEEKHRSASGKDQAAPGAVAGARPQRSGSGGHGGYRAGHVQPALDPPSPRVAACGFCNLFGKQEAPAPQPRAGAGSAKGKRR